MSGLARTLEALMRRGHLSEQRLDELATAANSDAVAGAGELAHLKDCGSCRGLIVGFQRTNAVLHGPWIERSATSAAAASAGVRVTRARRSRGTTGSVFGGSRTGRAAVAATAAIVVVAAGGLLGVRAIAPAASTSSPASSANAATNPTANRSEAAQTSQPGAFVATGSLLEAQMWPRATTLKDGRVLVTGGQINTSADINNPNLIPVAPEIYDPATGKFGKTGAMVRPCYDSKATLLSDGRVLITGGSTAEGKSSSAELYDPKTGTFSETGSMSEARTGHTATLLPDGRVLVAGGLPVGSGATAETYDPQTGRFTATGSMTEARDSQAAVLLKDGRVLIVGGFEPTTDGTLSPVDGKTSAEIYDPSSGKFSPTGPMTFERSNPDATLMPDGRVLVTGDSGGYSSEVYDPATGKFKAAGAIGTSGSMNVLLPDGLVLLAGGYEAMHGSLATALLYNPGTGKFMATGSMSTPRYSSASALLADGRVLVLGGLSLHEGNSEITDTAEIYAQPLEIPTPAPTPIITPAPTFSGPGGFVATGSMSVPREQAYATTLQDGRVLVTGGTAAGVPADVYDPATGKFSKTASAGATGTGYTAALLSDGRVLFAGGYVDSTTLKSAELYDPATGRFTSTGSMAQARAGATATLLKDGRVLIVGGDDSGFVKADGHSSQFVELASAELYDPKTGTFTPTGSMAQPRRSFATSLLADGRVLVTGGSDDATGWALDTAEIYDPTTGKFTATGSMTLKREGHTSTLLPSGLVLITGCALMNVDHRDTAELYDPATGKFTRTGSMLHPSVGGWSFPLLDGRILMAGGFIDARANPFGLTTEIYDPATGTFAAGPSLPSLRQGQAMALLHDGRILIVGGTDTNLKALATAILYDPAATAAP